MRLNKVQPLKQLQTTRCNHGQLLAVVLVYLRMCEIPLALGGSTHLSVCGDEGALRVERVAVLVPSSLHPLLFIVYQGDGCLSFRRHRGSWLGCQVLLAISVFSVLELASNSGNLGMSQAPNLHIVTQLFTCLRLQFFVVCLCGHNK